MVRIECQGDVAQAIATTIEIEDATDNVGFCLVDLSCHVRTLPRWPRDVHVGVAKHSAASDLAVLRLPLHRVIGARAFSRTSSSAKVVSDSGGRDRSDERWTSARLDAVLFGALASVDGSDHVDSFQARRQGRTLPQ